MHEEKHGAVPLPAAQPEVGDGISPPFADGPEDYAVERRVIESDSRLDYTCEELKELANNDANYQRICRKIQTEKNNPPPTRQELVAAKKAAKLAFLKWQEMQNFHGLKAAALEKLESERFQRLHWLAMRKAAHSIRNIQAVMGIRHIKNPRVPGFQSGHFAQRSLLAKAIARTLAEPLVAPGAPSIDESPKTPN